MDLLLDKVGALSRSIEELYFTTAYWTMSNIYIVHVVEYHVLSPTAFMRVSMTNFHIEDEVVETSHVLVVYAVVIVLPSRS